MKLTDYLRHYETSWARLHQSTPCLGSYKDRTLCSTWRISYQQVEKQFPLAAQLLRFWAYFDNQDLWFELIKPKDEGGPTWLRQLGDELVFNEAIGTLHDYGFVEPCAESLSACESQGYSIHGCLHSWAKHALNEGRNASLDRLALECVTSCVMQQLIDGAPNEDNAFQALRLERRLLSHAKISFARNQGRIKDSDLLILHALGQLYTSQVLLDDAENMYSLAVRGCERTYGPDHVNTFTFLARLGKIFGLQYRMKEAEDNLLRALCGQEKLLGTEHPFLVVTLDGLAFLYSVQGRLEEAKAMYQRVIQILERHWGPVTSKEPRGSHLGNLYMLQGRLPEVENMFVELLRESFRLLEVIRPDALYTMSGLADLYLSQGRLQEAEALWLKVVRAYEEILGRDAITTAIVLLQLGRVYLAQGRFEEAKKIYLEVLEKPMRKPGLEHQTAMFAALNLGYLYHLQSQCREAEAMWRRALGGFETMHGPNHEQILWLVSRLGHLCMEQDRADEAEPLLARALRGYEETIGPAGFTHSRVALEAAADMGMLRLSQDRREARGYLRRAHDGFLTLLGPNHARTRKTQTVLRELDQLSVID